MNKQKEPIENGRNRKRACHVKRNTNDFKYRKSFLES